MATEGRKRGLGKGLSALLSEEGSDFAELDRVRSSKTVPIDLLFPSPFQPRRRMSDEGLEELANSIADKGILQPILVRRSEQDPTTYEIIAGERRWRAAQLARLHDVPVVIKDLEDREALEIALVENVQRQDLSPLEEAEGYRRLMDEFDHTQDNLARSVGKSRSHVANTMRLLTLPDPVKTMLDDGRLTAGHARALIGVGDPAATAAKVVKRGLNVRQTEQLVKAEAAAPASAKGPEKDPDTVALERDLGNVLGLDVEIKLRRSGGSLVLHYRTLEQLDDILHRLSHARPGEGSHGRPTFASAQFVDEDEAAVAVPDEPLGAGDNEAAHEEPLGAGGNKADDEKPRGAGGNEAASTVGSPSDLPADPLPPPRDES